MNLANTYYLLQGYGNASQMLAEAEQIFTQHHHLDECHYCHLLQAQILLSIHQFDDAEQLMKALLLKTRNEHIRGKAYLILYKVYALQHQDKSLLMLNQAIFTFERGEYQEELIEALQLRIDYYQQKGRHHLAAVNINKLNGQIVVNNIDIVLCLQFDDKRPFPLNSSLWLKHQTLTPRKRLSIIMFKLGNRGNAVLVDLLIYLGWF